LIYFSLILAGGAVYLAFGWYSGGETAFRMQFLIIATCASIASTLISTRRYGR
jgi:hypothetical protein